MVINVHGGHNAKAPGASGLLDEVAEDRKVKDLVIAQLRALGHTAYDCTDDDGATANACLKNIVARCNSHSADLDVSIHFNAAANDPAGDGRTTGTEVLVYSASSAAAPYAANICAAIAALGFRNRGVKERPGLYVLKHTRAPALLVECCFVDDADDAALYNAGGHGGRHRPGHHRPGRARCPGGTARDPRPAGGLPGPVSDLAQHQLCRRPDCGRPMGAQDQGRGCPGAPD